MLGPPQNCQNPQAIQPGLWTRAVTLGAEGAHRHVGGVGEGVAGLQCAPEMPQGLGASREPGPPRTGAPIHAQMAAGCRSPSGWTQRGGLGEARPAGRGALLAPGAGVSPLPHLVSYRPRPPGALQALFELWVSALDFALGGVFQNPQGPHPPSELGRGQWGGVTDTCPPP